MNWSSLQGYNFAQLGYMTGNSLIRITDARDMKWENNEHRYTLCRTTDQVVQRLDSAIHWIKIYPVDTFIHLLNNWGQEFVTIGWY